MAARGGDTEARSHLAEAFANGTALEKIVESGSGWEVCGGYLYFFVMVATAMHLTRQLLEPLIVRCFEVLCMFLYRLQSAEL